MHLSDSCFDVHGASRLCPEIVAPNRPYQDSQLPVWRITPNLSNSRIALAKDALMAPNPINQDCGFELQRIAG
ncbi:hypothetical protein J1614_003363 [Plenodomus biglobosus]|nr:hypothetical protein J1614_003363 [Plenodomus biglobosus]